MRVFTIIMSITTMLALASLLLCGLWIGANGADAEGIAFHRMLGVVSVVLGIGVSIMAWINAAKRKKEKTI